MSCFIALHSNFLTSLLLHTVYLTTVAKRSLPCSYLSGLKVLRFRNRSTSLYSLKLDDILVLFPESKLWHLWRPVFHFPPWFKLLKCESDKSKEKTVRKLSWKAFISTRYSQLGCQAALFTGCLYVFCWEIRQDLADHQCKSIILMILITKDLIYFVLYSQKFLTHFTGHYLY